MMKKAVVLDGYTLTQDDLDWSAMSALCDLTVYDRTPKECLISRAKDAEILITNKTVIDAPSLKMLPKLRYIGVLATGYNVVDIDACREREIVVTNIPAYSTDSVAQMVFAHILNITQNIATLTSENRAGRWYASDDFCYSDAPLIELKGKTFGIIGLGNTGLAVAKIAMAFGMNVLAYTSKAQEELSPGIQKSTLPVLLSTSDIISLHCPLTAENQGFICRATLRQMKRSAILINTARGGLAGEEDLAEALNNGTIYAAGLDVMCEEPPHNNNVLINARNCYITPHVAWATREARERLMTIAVNNLNGFLEGRVVNDVTKI